MARFGKIPDSKEKLEVHIEGSEGQIPSIHICNGNGKNVICHISLIDNLYLRDSYETKGKRFSLNTYERKAFDEFMKSTSTGNTLTNWELCFMTWNVSNPKFAKNIQAYQRPSYLTIKEDK